MKEYTLIKDYEQLEHVIADKPVLEDTLFNSRNAILKLRTVDGSIFLLQIEAEQDYDGHAEMSLSDWNVEDYELVALDIMTREESDERQRIAQEQAKTIHEHKVLQQLKYWQDEASKLQAEKLK